MSYNYTYKLECQWNLCQIDLREKCIGNTVIVSKYHVEQNGNSLAYNEQEEKNCGYIFHAIYTIPIHSLDIH